MSQHNRREFLKKVGLSSLAYFTAEATTPNWIIKAARAIPLSCLTDGRILVILQQSGGNEVYPGHQALLREPGRPSHYFPFWVGPFPIA